MSANPTATFSRTDPYKLVPGIHSVLRDSGSTSWLLLPVNLVTAWEPSYRTVSDALNNVNTSQKNPG